MCGIAGVLRGQRQAKALLDALRHRGPDSQGSIELGACSLAVTRLAILDRSQRADQPMTYGDATIVLNGEIYNFADLRTQLKAFGWSFETSGDTEVLLKSLLQWGVGALARVRGMYAFLMWLADRQELWAARDRFGIKPLYWGPVDGDGVGFASEARALSELVGCEVSRRAVSEFLHFGSPYSSTAFEGISELSPGSISIWKADQSVEVHAIALARTEEQPIHAVLNSAVRSHLVSDRPVALFLSGGFDSALIASQLATVSEKPIAFTIDTGRNSDDVSAACRTAKHYGMAHQVIAYSTDQIDAQVEKYVGGMDQPTIDGFNTLLISNAVNAAGYPVGLSGLGGDEILAGYGYYNRAQVVDVARRPYLKLGTRARGAIDRVIAARTGRVAPQIASILEARSTPERYQAWRSVFTASEVQRLTGSRPQAPTLAWDDGEEEQGRDYRSLDFNVYLRSTLLRDSDLFSMACGVELRVPLLDSWFVDRVTAHLPHLDKSTMAAQLNDPYLAIVAARKKMPFRLPWSDWVTMLGSSTELLAEDDPWEGFVDPHEARRLIRDPDDGPVDRLLALLLLARWLRGLDQPRRIERRPV